MDKLPHESIMELMSYMTVSDLVNIRLTNKEMYKVCDVETRAANVIKQEIRKWVRDKDHSDIKQIMKKYLKREHRELARLKLIKIVANTGYAILMQDLNPQQKAECLSLDKPLSVKLANYICLDQKLWLDPLYADGISTIGMLQLVRQRMKDGLAIYKQLIYGQRLNNLESVVLILVYNKLADKIYHGVRKLSLQQLVDMTPVHMNHYVYEKITNQEYAL